MTVACEVRQREAGGPRPAARWSGRRGPVLEVLAVAVLAVAATAVSYRHLLARPSGTVPLDPTWDPVYFAWQLAWAGHAVRTDPGGLWTTNAFLHEHGNLAFTDTVLGYLPLSLLVGTDGMAAAVRGLALATVAATALAFLGAHLLARVLGARPLGALVAGAGFAFAPWRVQQIDHLNVLSTGGLALTLALLARGHGWSLRDGWRPERMRAGWLVAGWLAACWQITFGFALGVVFGYVLGAAMLLWSLGWLVRWRVRGRRPPLPLPVLLADGLGGLGFLAFTAALVQPFLHALAAHPEAARTEAYLGLFSPRWFGLFTGSEWSVWYGGPHADLRGRLGWVNETVLLPGYLLIALALIGLVLSRWPVRRRLLLAAVTVGSGVLALGVNGPAGGRWTFLPLWHHLPGWESIRTPGRLVVWVTLGLCLLAAGAVSWGADLLLGDPRDPRGPAPGRGRWAVAGLTLLLVLPTALVAAEGLGNTPVRPLPTLRSDLSALPQPVLVLPSKIILDYQVMLWGARGWPTLANGSSGFDPVWIQDLRREMAGFPDEPSVRALRRRGIRSVVLYRDWLAGSDQAAAAGQSIDGLGLTRRDDGDVVVYYVR